MQYGTVYIVHWAWERKNFRYFDTWTKSWTNKRFGSRTTPVEVDTNRFEINSKTDQYTIHSAWLLYLYQCRFIEEFRKKWLCLPRNIPRFNETCCVMQNMNGWLAGWLAKRLFWPIFWRNQIAANRLCLLILGCGNIVIIITHITMDARL